MTSIGEVELTVESRLVGKVRVLNLFADNAAYPRLGITLGVTLRDAPENEQDTRAVRGFELRELTGELRLQEGSEAVGLLSWTGAKRHVRSGSYGYEAQIKCVCDLDSHRIETIERARDGAAPELWMELWPVLVTGGSFLNSDAPTFRLRPPREMWLDFLKSANGVEYALIEIQYSVAEAATFRRAVERAREAREQLARGEYDEAVAACRKVVEALNHEISEGSQSEGLQSLFVRTTDEKRAKEYSGIVSRIKQLAGFSHHDFGTPLTYSRAEAQFVVRVTESVLALASSLVRNGTGVSRV